MTFTSGSSLIEPSRTSFDSEQHLKNARVQADVRKYDEFLIVDVDSHHYET